MERDGSEGESENGGLAPGQRETQSLTNFQKDPGDKGCIPVLSASSDSPHSLLFCPDTHRNYQISQETGKRL